MSESIEEPDLIAELADAHLVPEAAKVVRLSVPALWRHILSGRLRSVKVGGRRFVPRQALVDFVRACNTPRTRQPTTARRRSPAELRRATEAAIETAKTMGS
jgi:excisionase family DNA binding protein